jgi:hypothetical protein
MHLSKLMSKKLTFTLRNIDVREVNNKYGLHVETRPSETTSIDELYVNKNDFVYPFLDPSKRCYITMIDSMTHKRIQCQYCFWCRHAFNTQPIGCPIRYVCNKIRKSMTSELTNETYSIVQSITSEEAKCAPESVPEYYETDGGFCSFNCCLAFIKDQSHNQLYRRSEELLMKMYVDIFQVDHTTIKRIDPAPSWRLLKEYGGFMTIEEFRNSFQSHIYIDKDYTFSKPLRPSPIGRIYEEQIVI